MMVVVAVAARLLSLCGISTLDLALTDFGTSRKPSWSDPGLNRDRALGELLLGPFCVCVCSVEDMLVLLLTELEKPEFRDVDCEGAQSVPESSENRCRSSKLVTARIVEFIRVGIWCCCI
jgi:hypothetical protein